MSTPFWSASVSAFWSGCLHLLISKWHWLQKPKFQLSSGLSPPFDQQVTLTSKISLDISTFWSGCLHLWLHLLFWSGCLHLWVSPAFWSGCLHLLISKWHWLQKPKFGCLHLLIRVFPPFDQGVSAFWSASDTGCGMSLPFDQQVTLTSLSYFHWGFQGLSSPFDQQWYLTSRGVVSAFWLASDTDFKNLSPNFQMVGCLHLLASDIWLQKPKFGHLHPLIRVSPPFDQVHLHLLCCLLFDQVSPPFDQQVTLTSKT